MADFKITDKSGIKLKTANKYVMEDLTVTLTNEDFSNLVSENIRKGKTILNIPGSLEEGIDTSDATAIPSDILVGKTAYANNEKIEGTMSEYDGTFENGEDNTIEDGLVTRTLTSYSNDRITKVGDYAFYQCSSLTSVSLPNVTSIGNSAFNSCSNLTNVSFPQVTSIGNSAFNSCSNLTNVSFPQVTNIEYNAFYNCPKLTNINIPNATNIGNMAFGYCRKITNINLPQVTTIGYSAFERCYSLLKLVITQTNKVCTLSSTGVFTECYHFSGTVNNSYNPQGLKDGRIYVPDSLVDSYKSATNWSAYADIIVGLSELPAEE